jgi:Bacteriophage HK97-gp10, putative tail-component
MSDLSLHQFKADIAAFAKLVDVNQATVVKKIAFDLWTKITLKTPVKTGRARAGWGLSINSPIVATPPVGSYSAPGTPDFSKVDGKQIVYILNNVEYVPNLEDGSSKQAPAGMVRLSIMEIESEIEVTLQMNP